MNLLNENNPVHIFLNKIGDIVIANLLFVLFSLPVLTIGPALTALYHCTLRSVKGNNNGTIKTFLHAFKQNFVQSLILWLGIIAAGVILLFNIQFLSSKTGLIESIFLYLSWGISILLVILFLYVFPVVAAFSNKIAQQVKNAFAFAFMHFFSTLGIAAISIFPFLLTYQDFRLMPLYVCCWFFFGFGLIAYINSILFYRMFKPFLDS